MKDVFGNELEIGDDVIFVDGANCDSELGRGKISKFYKGRYGDDECSVGRKTHIKEFRVAKIESLLITDGIRMSNQEGKPKCYSPEKDISYPLCIGNGNSMCEECGLYTDLKSPYDDEIHEVIIE